MRRRGQCYLANRKPFYREREEQISTILHGYRAWGTGHSGGDDKSELRAIRDDQIAGEAGIVAVEDDLARLASARGLQNPRARAADGVGDVGVGIGDAGDGGV